MKEQVIGFRFGNFEIDLKNRQLKTGEQVIPLNSKYFDVLTLLVENHHQLTSKQAIFDKVWQDTIVTDSALSQCIKDIRKSLGDDAHNPRFIKTVAKHGYIFIADVFPVLHDRMGRSISVPSPIRPYKFLDYFTEEDRQLFFGREHEIEILRSKILAHRSFILHGRSGVGKSSLIRAGVIPALKELGHQTFIIRSFLDPTEQMLESLLPFLPVRHISKSPSALKNILQKLKEQYPNRLFIFFFDQFEDFFLLLNEEHRNTFLSYLTEMFKTEQSSFRLVFVLREDLLAELSFFKPVIPEIFHHEYRLLKLSNKQAIRAILEPAQTVNCPFEEKLAKEILLDLSNGKEDIDPPQLQIVCDVLYDSRDPQAGITGEHYRLLGGASRILESYMDRVLHRFDGRELDLVRSILKSLITIESKRLVLPVEDLVNRLSDAQTSPSKIKKLLNELSDARLVRLGRQEGKNWAELSHDFLIPRIREWISDEEQNIRRAQAMIKRAMDNYHHHGLLLDEDAIQILLPFENHLDLSHQEARFIATSMLYRRYILPKWLKEMIPDLPAIIEKTIKANDPGVRMCTIESCLHIKDPKVMELLTERALWDEDLNVRKAASIVFLKNSGLKGQAKLAQGKNHKKAGLIRRAISLSFVRDYDITLVYLRKLPLLVALLVVTGLIWVRIYRNRRQITREISGATMGATLSGLLVGSLLAGLLAFVRHAQSFETITYLLVLISLGALATFFAGLGISSGIVLMRHVTYRHSQWWTVVGGTLGGMLIGGIVNLIGVDILRALFGQELIDITGALEGAILGFCLSLGMTIAEQLYPQKILPKVITAAFAATLGAITLSLFKGNLFSGSIAAITRSFANAEIKFEPLASLIGEGHFGLLSKLILSSIEGFFFGGLLMAGLEFFRNRHKH